jgi:hypothetical protein
MRALLGLLLVLGLANCSSRAHDPDVLSENDASQSSLARPVLAIGRCSAGVLYRLQLKNAASGDGVVARLDLRRAGSRVVWDYGISTKSITDDGSFAGSAFGGHSRTTHDGLLVLRETISGVGGHRFSVVATQRRGPGVCDISIAG